MERKLISLAERRQKIIDALDSRLPSRQDISRYCKLLKIPNKDVLAMTSVNDPFWCGTLPEDVTRPGESSQTEKAQWAKEVWDKIDPQGKIHVRGLHYKFSSLPEEERKYLDGSIYENDAKSWSHLEDAVRYARILGYLNPISFEDKRSFPPKYNCSTILTEIDRDDFSWHKGDIDWETKRIRWIVDPEIIAKLKPHLSFPGAYIEGYGYEYSRFDQPYRLAVFIEKSVMDDELTPICQKYGVDFFSGKGFTSHTAIIQLLKRIVEMYGNKPARIFYISDYDLSGQDMPNAAACLFQFYGAKYFPDADVKLEPIALKEEQTYYTDEDGTEKQIPKAPDKEQIELDALEIYCPGRLAEILKNQILNYYDSGLISRYEGAERLAQERLDSAWEDATEEHQETLGEIEERIEQITEKYEEKAIELNSELQEALVPFKEKLGQLNTEMEEELEPYKEQLDELKEEIYDIEPGVEFPEVPESDIEPPDESDWFFDSQRTYKEQMDFYNKYKMRSIRAKEKGGKP